MKDQRLKEIHKTLAFMKSVIESGEPMTQQVKNEFSRAINNLESVDGDLN
jgi:hypothetical protein